jgi:hypothetical protein
MVRNIKKINKNNPMDYVTKMNRENFSWLFELPIDVSDFVNSIFTQIKVKT